MRVEARRLRQKLTRFYEREGASCTLEIHLDAGGYVPTFELRPQASVEGLPSLVVLPFVNLSGDAAIDAWCDALTVHHNYAWTLMFAGRFGEAEQEFAIARELDPLAPMLRVHHALVAFYRRDFDEAVEALRRVLEMEPQNLVARVLSASAHLGLGALDEALALFARIAADVPADSIGPLGVVQAHALAGRMQEARAAFDVMRERFGEARVGPYRMAIAFTRLGDADSAFTWLDRSAAARDLNLVCLAVDPSFDALRDDPRWRPALVRYGLPPIDPRGPRP